MDEKFKSRVFILTNKNKFFSSIALSDAGDFNIFDRDPFKVLTFLKTNFAIVDQIAT